MNYIVIKRKGFWYVADVAEWLHHRRTHSMHLTEKRAKKERNRLNGK